MEDKPGGDDLEKEMRILGIDPGLQVSGYACLESTFGNIKLIEAGVFRISAKQAMEVRLNQIAEDIEAVLKKYKPDGSG